eukprot:NODE_3129_length_1042_cov_27.720040_g2875_i0.p1 GENE.NODE_3129_length_1042_cov_27.720040_g2875_i0~~NODE_3129_length_1042_cov_27.720040_g2875_i0.p1  ORF type:complete len:275 (-),score=40.01 NODE_3129_length_1042_cov_27.720040_g2875_i0:51-875(-)
MSLSLPSVRTAAALTRGEESRLSLRGRRQQEQEQQQQQSFDSLTEAAYAHLANGENALAAACFKDALLKSPLDVQTMYNIASTEQLMGHVESAKQYLQLAMKSSLQNAEESDDSCESYSENKKPLARRRHIKRCVKSAAVGSPLSPGESKQPIPPVRKPGRLRALFAPMSPALAKSSFSCGTKEQPSLVVTGGPLRNLASVPKPTATPLPPPLKNEAVAAFKRTFASKHRPLHPGRPSTTRLWPSQQPPGQLAQLGKTPVTNLALDFCVSNSGF